VCEAHFAKLDAKLEVYDKILAKQRYLAGDVRAFDTSVTVLPELMIMQEITLADLFHLPGAAALNIAGSDLMTSRPNVARWYKELADRPAWKAVAGGVKGLD
jgi:glutathione S-transferase